MAQTLESTDVTGVHGMVVLNPDGTKVGSAASSSPANTGTTTQVADTATSTTILASNTSRKGATIYNDSSALLYLRLASGTASSTDYSVRVYPNGYYEVPSSYVGTIVGIWASDPNDGGAKVTEFTYV